MNFGKNGVITSSDYCEIPNIYKRVEYIQSTGTQYIDTGINGASDLIIRCKFLLGAGYCVFGYRDSTNLEGINFRLFTSSNKWYLDYGTGSGGNRIMGSSFSKNTIYHVEVGNRYVNDIESNSTIISGTPVSYWSQTPSIGIFGAPVWADSSYSAGSIYYLTIQKNEEYLRYLLPVKRLSDNKPGMYDVASGTFFVNSGTGDFTPGPDLGNNVGIYSDKVVSNNFIEI